MTHIWLGGAFAVFGTVLLASIVAIEWLMP